MYNRILIQIEATQLPRKSLHQKFNYSLLFKTSVEICFDYFLLKYLERLSDFF